MTKSFLLAIFLLFSGMNFISDLETPEIGATESARHNLHISYGRMVATPEFIELRVRIFKNDLENTLINHHKLKGFVLVPTLEVDSLFLDYFNTQFSLSAGGKNISPQIMTSGEQENMWWYSIAFTDSNGLFNQIELKNTLLLDQFEDQKNILKVLTLPNENERTFYFATGAETNHFEITP